MQDKNDLASLWIQKAEHDLIAAESLIITQQFLTDIICFHCQQASEKFIKAYLIFLEIDFEKSHDLDYLLGLIENRDDFDTSLYDSICKLENFAVELRYPNQIFEPSLDEAKAALESSWKIKKIILQKIKF